MSSYLQIATETADLIEYGRVEEGPTETFRDFDRLLGITEARRKQRMQLDLKREEAIAEIEHGRQLRADLRGQMQQSRHQRLLDDIAQKKEDERRAKEETTLRKRLEDALAKPQAKTDAEKAAENTRADPFARFRAEDHRAQTDRQRLGDMRQRWGVRGSDILRRYLDGSANWAGEGDEEANQKRHNSVATVANLLTDGYGSGKSASYADKAVEWNKPVEKTFGDLTKQDAADLAEWRHRRQFYDRERIKVLEQMARVSEMRPSFSTTVSDLAKPRAGSAAVLGHEPDTEAERAVLRGAHPIDEYHAEVRASVVAVHRATEPHQVLTGQRREALAVGSALASASSSKQNSARR